MENPNAEAVLDRNEDGELNSSTEENGENLNSATSEDGSLENDELWSMGSPGVQQQVKELTSSIKDLVSQMRLQDSDDHTEVVQQNIDYYDLTQIQNMKVDELQEHLLKMGRICRKLTTDIKIQEQTHLREIEELNQRFKIKLTAKDKFSLELKEKMERLQEQFKAETEVCFMNT
ncbi:hypothetical protein ACLKA7_017210 [Drosophila subpalustris]